MAERRLSHWAPPLLAAVLVLGGYFAWQRQQAAEAARPATAARGQDSGQPPPAVPVTIASAEKGDFPLYLTGLGTVQAYNTVVVRTRVDGQIDKVAYTEGQVVKAGDLLVQIDPRPFQAALDQARAKKTQDEANLANANLDLQRYTKLGDYATRQQTDTQKSTVQQVTAQIAADQAAIEIAQTQLGYATIRAPLSGITGFRQVDQGNIVNASTQTGIVTITQIEPISVVFTAPEEQLTEINKAQASHPLDVSALSTDGHTVLSKGVLSVVNNQVDAASGTIRLKATFANKDHALWPGLSVSTRLLVGTSKDVVIVPDEAVQHGPNGLFVFVVDQDGKAAVKKIKVRRSDNGRSLVDEGLAPGERVITAGQYRVQPGSLVRAVVASAQPTAAEGN